MEYPVNTLEQLKPLLRGFRRKAGLTQANVAALLGVTQQSYAKIEANPSATSVERLFTVLRLLGARISLHHETPSTAKESPEEQKLDDRQSAHQQPIVKADDRFNDSQTEDSKTRSQTGGTFDDQRLKDAQMIARIVQILSDRNPRTNAQFVRDLNTHQNKIREGIEALNKRGTKDSQKTTQTDKDPNDQRPINPQTVAEVVKNLREQQNRGKHLASGSHPQTPAKNRKINAPSKLVPPSGKKETW